MVKFEARLVLYRLCQEGAVQLRRLDCASSQPLELDVAAAMLLRVDEGAPCLRLRPVILQRVAPFFSLELGKVLVDLLNRTERLLRAALLSFLGHRRPASLLVF